MEVGNSHGGGDITPNAFRKDVYYEYDPKHDPTP